ncbi:MAG: HD-GYP domain-containing protein [Lachnospiraceae bacterium]|nr:HD-GYP domain-containing protein [Lachnospiraceae bacterium]
MSLYLSYNFITFMIMVALIAMMYVNRDVKIPGTNLFVMCLFFMFILTIAGVMDQSIDVSVFSPEKANFYIKRRLIACVIAYALRPCIILTELIIIFQKSKYRYLCLIPAVINALIYSTALFGSTVAFTINNKNQWRGGPLKISIYATLIIYVLLLLYGSLHFFQERDKRKSVLLLIIVGQAILSAVMEYTYVDPHNYSNEVMALCILEYYVYLTNVYRQELNNQLDAYVEEVEQSGAKLKALTVDVMKALASAIDAKDKYTHGHSARVAEYSRRLARMNGKSDQECDEIYYAALLHDVGKIGIPESIITKEGRLTKEEYEKIQEHPVLGKQILQQISEFPYLSIGAYGHHERYDGKGYPQGLKGTDIPEAARIISVADAYDTMTSKRSYRDPIPQQIVREEIVKGTGTQFDPAYARIMLHMIDEDLEFEMREREEVVEMAGNDELIIDEYRSAISAGILLTPALTTITVRVKPLEESPDVDPIFALILFDSLDARVHRTEKRKQDLNYYEYGEIRSDGPVQGDGVRNIRVQTQETDPAIFLKENEYRIEGLKIKDHARIRLIGRKETAEVIFALPDSARFFYIGLTGEHCNLRVKSIEKASGESAPDAIPRIAEEISFINVPAGDLPNVQIDGYRTDSSDGVEIRDGLQLSFHVQTLPTARLVWHCPFMVLFSADDGKIKGKNYREYAFLRFDGEAWECDPDCTMKMNVNRLEEFGGWDEWKQFNRDGYDAVVTFKEEDDKITIITENDGISIRNSVIIKNNGTKIYTAITGDQIVLTDIRVRSEL